MDNTNTPLEIPPAVKVFLAGLLEDAGMLSLDEETKEEMIKELYLRLDSYLTAVIINKLPKENLEEFLKMNEDKKSMAEIEAYLKSKLPNAQEIFTEAFADFRETYLSGTIASNNLEVKDPAGKKAN